MAKAPLKEHEKLSSYELLPSEKIFIREEGPKNDIIEPRLALQKESLARMIDFFIYSNVFLFVTIFLVLIFERLFFNDPNKFIVTDKVLIASIGGITIQAGAIVIAAFKGLFTDK